MDLNILRLLESDRTERGAQLILCPWPARIWLGGGKRFPGNTMPLVGSCIFRSSRSTLNYALPHKCWDLCPVLERLRGEWFVNPLQDFLMESSVRLKVALPTGIEPVFSP